MEYRGRYTIFDSRRISTYPMAGRDDKVAAENLVDPGAVSDADIFVSDDTAADLDILAEAIVAGRRQGKAVILFTGAHLIKNGLGRILIDLVRCGMVTLVAGNGATAIHDFELALLGRTHENVPQSLGEGRFGMAYEFCYQNLAIRLGNQHGLGYGETLGRMICDASFRAEVIAVAANANSPREFLYPQASVLAACYESGIPFTVHVGIGTDVTDQHPSVDGAAKGGCSGRDFLIYVHEATKLARGGVVLNIGSSVTGPEVLLKAVSMASNVGLPPEGLVTANFDLIEYKSAGARDDSSKWYYLRDQKSVVARIPQAFRGWGYHIAGNQMQTVPLLYKKIKDKWARLRSSDECRAC